MSLFNELKRRNVVKVAIAYLVVAWLVMQVADVILSNIVAPGWIFHVLLLLLAIGLPLAMVFAWAFELTPDGLQRESDLGEAQATPERKSQTLNFVIIGVLAIAVSYFAISGGGLGDDPPSTVSTSLTRPSVLVLPFANTSSDESRDYLSLGITYELIAGLQRYKDFPVISLKASQEYEGSGLSVDDFAANLGASYLVEGSITTAEDGMRILASLSYVGGEQVWADRFVKPDGYASLTDFADELVSRVAAAVLDSEFARVQRADRPPADAWEHYIRGLDGAWNFNPAIYEAARHELDLAVEISPEMAEAWSAIGELEVANYVFQSHLQETGLDDLYEIIGYFRKAHELSPYYPAACGCLGFMLAVVGQHDEARIVFTEALEANPLSADLQVTYASFLLMSGDYDGAMERSDIALALGPASFDRAAVWSNRAIVALAEGRSADVQDAVNRAMFISKNGFHVPMAVTLLYIIGERDAAARLLDEMDQTFPAFSPENPVLYGVLKPIDDILTQRRARGEQGDPNDVAEIFASLRLTRP